MSLKKNLCSNLINDSLISALRPGLKIGVENDIFWSTKGSGFEEQRAHPHQEYHPPYSVRRGSFLFPNYLGRSKGLCVKGTPPGNELLKPNYILFSLRLLLIILFKILKVYGLE